MLYTITAERLQALLYADTLLDQLSAMGVDSPEQRERTLSDISARSLMIGSYR